MFPNWKISNKNALDVCSIVYAMKEAKSITRNQIAHETLDIVSDLLQLTYWVWYKNDSVREMFTTSISLIEILDL